MLARFGLAVVMLSLSAAAFPDEVGDRSVQQATAKADATPEIVVTAEKLGEEANLQITEVNTPGTVQNAVLVDLAGRLSRDVEHRNTFWED